MYTYKRTVHYHETDKMGITHHSNYVKWMEEARLSLLDSIGLSFRNMEDEGIMSPVVSINVNYKSPSTYSDIIEIDITIGKYTGAQIIFDYNMRNTSTGNVSAVASSRHCFIKDGQVCSLSHAAPNYDKMLRDIIEEVKTLH